MGAQWKPGDVANTLKNGTQPAFRTAKGWTYIDGSTQGVGADEYGFRPLLMIDPNSHWDLWKEFQSRREQGLNPKRALHDAIHALANPAPPKPDEPQGLGAVVRDARGVLWVRSEKAKGCVNPWAATLAAQEPDEVRSLRWVEIEGPEVLSAGWSE